MKGIAWLMIVAIAFLAIGCSSSDVVTGSVMKRKYRSGLYVAKKSNASKLNKRFIKELNRQPIFIADAGVGAVALKKREVSFDRAEMSVSTKEIDKRLVANTDGMHLDYVNELYWAEEANHVRSTLDSRFLEITLGVLCFLAAIAAFVGLIFGVVELTRIVTGSSSSGMSGTVALALLVFGLPIAIAVVWTLIALGVKLFKGE